MLTLRFACFLALFLIGFPQLHATAQSNAQWISTQGPGVATVRSVDIDSDGTLFATTGVGAEISRSAGDWWGQFVYYGRLMHQGVFVPNEIMYFIQRKDHVSTPGAEEFGTYEIEVWEILEQDLDRGSYRMSGFKRLQFPAIGNVTNIPTAADGAGYFGIGHTIWYYIGWGNGLVQASLAGRHNPSSILVW